MKKINEMTEKEILALSNEELQVMVNIEKAEAGIKIMKKPIEPIVVKFPDTNKTVFQCDFFGNNLAFTNIAEFQALIDLISKSVSKVKLDYDWNVKINGSSYTHFIVKNPNFANEMNVTSKKVYSNDVYEPMKDAIASNKVLTEAYDKQMKEYNEAVNASKDIVNAIFSEYQRVCAKYNELETLCCRMREDYMPLAENDEKIALKFLAKAYNLTDEQIEYVTANYVVQHIS